MNFETNKFYRTRDGHKAVVWMLDNGGGNMLGAVFIQNWLLRYWNEYGCCIYGDAERDLIAEWEEPKKPKLMAPAIVRWNREEVSRFELSSYLYENEKTAKTELKDHFHSWPAVPNAEGFYRVKE